MRECVRLSVGPPFDPSIRLSVRRTVTSFFFSVISTKKHCTKHPKPQGDHLWYPPAHHTNTSSSPSTIPALPGRIIVRPTPLQDRHLGRPVTPLTPLPIHGGMAFNHFPPGKARKKRELGVIVSFMRKMAFTLEEPKNRWRYQKPCH